MNELERLTARLVEIPSHEDETAAGDAIEAWLRDETEATVERDTHGNVIGRRGKGDETLALVGHHDVVPPDESQVDGESFLVESNDGRLYGRGAADMKGAVAAAMCAFRDADVGDKRELVFVSYTGEEIGGVGARGAIEDGFVPDYAIVGEGSTGYSASGVTDVAIAHRGRRASTLTVSGSAAHASEPEQGVNAIYRASDAVDAVRELEPPSTTVFGHDVVGSAVVTEIAGGTAWNVIPETCTVTIDERTVPDGRAPLEDVTTLPGVEWTVDQDLPPMACDDESFADFVLETARAVHEGGKNSSSSEPQHVIKPHATDAGWLAAAGTTCVVCGPAEAGEAHTADESVSLATLERCRQLYQRAAEAFTSQPVV